MKWLPFRWPSPSAMASSKASFRSSGSSCVLGFSYGTREAYRRMSPSDQTVTLSTFMIYSWPMASGRAVPLVTVWIVNSFVLVIARLLCKLGLLGRILYGLAGGLLDFAGAD